MFPVNFVLQVGIGLLVLQQLGGINGVLFYSSTIFESAGRVKCFSWNVPKRRINKYLYAACFVPILFT